MMVNCAAAPRRMSNGRCASSLKSFGVSVSPIVSIMMPRMMVCVFPLTHAKIWGKKNVTTAVRMMNRLALELRKSLSFFSIGLD